MNYIQNLSSKVDDITSSFTKALTEETRLIMKLTIELKDCRKELCKACGKSKDDCKGCRWE